jgi:anti-sigma factor RsiW
MESNDQNLPLACTRTRALLARYGDGELEEPLAAPLRGHLLECPACRAELAALRNLARWIVAPDVPPVPAGFAERVAALAFAGRGAAAPAGALAGAGLGARLPMVELTPLARAAAAPGPARHAEEPVLRFVLWMTAMAAAALLLLALALGSAERPAGEELVAEPLPEVLQQLDQLNRELEAGGTGAQR